MVKRIKVKQIQAIRSIAMVRVKIISRNRRLDLLGWAWQGAGAKYRVAPYPPLQARSIPSIDFHILNFKQYCYKQA